MYSDILVPVDGSVPSTLGVKEAVKLATVLHAHIQLLHVLKTPTLFVTEDNADLYPKLMDFLRDAGNEVLRAAALIVSKAGIAVDTAIAHGCDIQVGATILRKAREFDCKLIVCGTHGRRGAVRLLMGSDAEYVVRHSHVPVLLVREITPSTTEDSSLSIKQL